MMNNPLIRRIGATLVAVLLLVYVGYQIYLSHYSGLSTEPAMYATVSDTIDTTGFIIRNEKVISSSYSGVLNYTLDDGEKVSTGGVIAEIFPSEEDAAAKNQIARLDSEIERLTALDSPSAFTSSNPKMIGSQISKKVSSIVSAMKSGSFTGIMQQKNDLQLLLNQKQIITGVEEKEDYTAHLEKLKTERSALKASSSASIGTVTAPASGYFISSIDGFENSVSIDDVTDLKASDITALEEESATQTDSSSIGKIAMNFNWYIACVITENDLVHLDRTTNVTVEMPFATAETIPAQVVQVNRDSETGGAAIILKCTYMNSELAAARKEPIQINVSNYSGVLVNEKAIHFADVTVTKTDENGVETETVYNNIEGVYVKYGDRLRFVQIFSDATINGYAVCKTSLSSDEQEMLVTDSTIQLYDEVVVEGTDLYDGKLL